MTPAQALHFYAMSFGTRYTDTGKYVPMSRELEAAILAYNPEFPKVMKIDSDVGLLRGNFPVERASEISDARMEFAAFLRDWARAMEVAAHDQSTLVGE